MKHKKTYIWGIIGRISPQGINLLVNMVLARFLSPADFGKIGVLSVFIAIATTLTDSGLGGSLVKERKVSTEDCKTVFTFNLIVSLICYGIIFLASGLIEDFYHIEGLQTIVKWLALVFILGATSIVPKSIMIRNLQFKQLSIISIISYILSGIIAIIGGVLNWGVYALVIFQLSVVGINAILINIISKYWISFGFYVSSFKRLLSFGVFTTLCNIIDSIYDNILSILFGKFTSVSFVGYYSQAKKIEVGSSNSIVSAINTVAFPILTRIRDDKVSFIKESNSLFKWMLYTIIPLISMLAIFSKELISLCFGFKWLEAAEILPLLLINGVFFICESLVRNNIKSLGEVKTLAKITLLKRIIGIGVISSCLLISGYAMLYGLILSTVIGFIANVIIYCKSMHLSIIHQILNYLSYFILPVVISGFIWVLHIIYDHNFYLTIIISCLILLLYYYSLYKEIKKESKKTLLK